MHRLNQLLAAILVTGCASWAHAQPTAVLNIDFGTDVDGVPQSPVFEGDSGVLGIADPGGLETAVWNGLFHEAVSFGATATGLSNSEGALTGVTLSTTFNSPTGFGNDFNAPNGAQERAAATALLTDYFFLRPGEPANTVTFGGLVPGSTFDLFIFGQGDTAPGQVANFTAGGVTQTTSFDGTPGGDGSLVEGVEYVVFEELTADTSGEISFLWEQAPMQFSALNGLQLVGPLPPAPVPLNLEVNTSTGEVRIQNTNLAAVSFDAYTIQTDQGTLDDDAWNSLTEQEIGAAATEGDFNGDGSVDVADYTVWRDNLGQPSDGNLENDSVGGTVGIDQYNLWVDNFGEESTNVGFAESGNTGDGLLAEFFLGAPGVTNVALGAGDSFSLGEAFTGSTDDGTLTFEYNDTNAGELVTGTVSFVSAAVSAVPEPSVALLGFVAAFVGLACSQRHNS